jgi:hypothetical protein
MHLIMLKILDLSATLYADSILRWVAPPEFRFRKFILEITYSSGEKGDITVFPVSEFSLLELMNSWYGCTVEDS